MVSAAKPLITWTCRDTVQECREACGGHGYLKGFLCGIFTFEICTYFMFPVLVLIPPASVRQHQAWVTFATILMLQ